MQYFSYNNILIIGLLISLILSVNQYSNNRKLLVSQGNGLNDSTSYYENKLGSMTATKKVLELEKRDLNNLLYSRNTLINSLQKEFAKVSAIIQTESIVTINDISVPFETKSGCYFDSRGNHLDKWFQFDYTLNQNGVTFSEFRIPNKQTAITGFKRIWFFGKQTYVTDITNSNPYIKTVEVETVQVVVPKRFYDTRLFNIGIGFIGGVLVSR